MTTIADCLGAVEAEFRIGKLDLLSERRARNIARPRQIVMWLARHSTGASLPKIGQKLDRDHSTVMHGIAVIDKLREEHSAVRDMTDRLLTGLLQSGQNVMPVTPDRG